MRIKTIIIVAIVILLAIIFFQNQHTGTFAILFFSISKTSTMLVVAVVAFIAGYLAGKPGRSKYNHLGYDEDAPNNTDKNTLSDEDKDYLS
ncbi:hypothetical protein [Mucilaginibacter gilvus]|uniref:LapA family protein n=1 Tax=Mucilaginibacter gilvus TaxID=2305909 RepID=A0A3S3WHD1_9SPHI|nr:hypothetical protein [Mucilaginibacter gilvus]RWY57074.1 hypothetical protein EPL05_00640 [Mucilaginibacter gilvus]